MKNEIIIRNAGAGKDDAAAVAEICKNDLGYECDGKMVATALAALDLERENVFVAECGGTVAGFIHVELYRLLYFPLMANVLGIAVAGEFRRSGIGARLLKEAENWAAAKGASSMRVNSGGGRHEAHKFYAAQNYESGKEQLRFLKEL